MKKPLILAIVALTGGGLSAPALEISFPSAPVAGQDFKVAVNAPGKVGCENGIGKVSLEIAGTGTRTVSLGKIPDIGFYRLLFKDVTTGQTEVVTVAAFPGKAGATQKAPVSPDPLAKYLANMNSTNAKRWYQSFDAKEALASQIVAMSTAGTLGIVCVAAFPVGCKEAAAATAGVAVDLTLDFLKHAGAEMVKEGILTAAEGASVKQLFNHAGVVKALATADMANVTSRVLTGIEIINIQLDDPKARLVIGLQKDAAGKADALIGIIRKLP